MELKIKALSPKIGTEIPLPRFATAGAACMDLCACIDEAVTLAAGARRPWICAPAWTRRWRWPPAPW